MLESGNMLRAWALATLPRGWQAAHFRTQREDECPPLAPGNEVAAVQLADHRHAYLDYEGELSGERGTVIRVAEGSYRVRGDETEAGLTCTIDGDLPQSLITLRRDGQTAEQWALECKLEEPG
jgi:hypothetical protein